MKLQDIQYSPGAQPNLRDPGIAVSEYKQKQQILGEAFTVAGEIANQKAEADTIRANAEHRQDVENYKVWAAQHPTATREDLAAWASANLDDPTVFNTIDTTEFDNRKEADLPQHAWYARGLEAVIEGSRAKRADQIAGPKVKRAWLNHTRTAGGQEIEAAKLHTAQAQTKYEMDRIKGDVDLAIEQGDYARAEDLLQASLWKNNPVQRDALRQAVLLGSKRQEVDLALLQAESTEDFDEILANVTSSEWSAGISSDETLKMAQSVITMRNAAATADKKALEDYQDATALAALVAVSTGELNQAGLNSLAPQLGLRNYITVQSGLRTQASQGTVTDPRFDRSMTTLLVELRAGIYEGDFNGAIADANSVLVRAIGDGTISVDDAASYSKELSTMKEFPYKTEQFTALSKELRDRIIGAPDGSTLSFLASDESRMEYANAMEDLRAYVEANGGTAADLGAWKANNMPRYLNTVARRSFFKLPDGAKDVAVFSDENGVFKVDFDRTVEAMQAEMINIKNNAFMDEAGKQRAIQELKANIDKFEQWNNTMNRGN